MLSGETSIGMEVTAFFRTLKASFCLSCQVSVLDEPVRSKRG